MTAHRGLAEIFRRLIATTGPISLAHYMAEANARYYAKADPLGAGGDFVTAPEISQMFGELIGLWLADLWIRAGREEPVHYVELGPGRGTLARDALRAMKRYGLEPRPHFVETSTALKELQLDAVPGAFFHADLSTVPMDGPVLLVANEFLDALPVRQLIRTADGWREVMVVADGDRFTCIPGARPMDAAVPESRRERAGWHADRNLPGRGRGGLRSRRSPGRARRRGAVHRLRPCRSAHRLDLPGRPPAQEGRSVRSARRGRTSPRTSTSRCSRKWRNRAGAAGSAPSPKANGFARSASRAAPRR